MKDSPEYVFQLMDGLKQTSIRRYMLPDTLGILNPLQVMEYMLVPFLLQCSVIVDEMSAAVMARGFDKNMPRTSYAEVQMKALDWCIIAVSAGLLFWNLCF